MDSRSFLYPSQRQIVSVNLGDSSCSVRQIEPLHQLTAFAAAPTAGLFAVAAEESDPSILVKDYASDEVVAELKGGARFRYEAVALSRGGGRCIAFSSDVGYGASAWTVPRTGSGEPAEAEARPSASAPIEFAPVQRASFCPTDSSIAAASGPTGLQFWHVVRRGTRDVLLCVPATMQDDTPARAKATKNAVLAVKQARGLSTGQTEDGPQDPRGEWAAASPATGLETDAARAMTGMALAQKFAGLGGPGPAAEGGVLPTPEVIPHLLGEDLESDGGSGSGALGASAASVGGLLPLQAGAGGASVQVAGLQLEDVQMGGAAIPDGSTVGGPISRRISGAASAATPFPITSGVAGSRAFTFAGSSASSAAGGRASVAGNSPSRPPAAVAAGVGGMGEAALLGLSETEAAGRVQVGMPDNGWPVVQGSAAAAAWEARRRILAHCWDGQGLVLASNDFGWLMRFDPSTGECTQTVEPCPGAAVSALFVTSEFVIAGCTDGVVRVLEAEELTLHRQFELLLPLPRLGPPPLLARGLGLPPGPSRGERGGRGMSAGGGRGYDGFRVAAQRNAGAVTSMAALPDLSELVVATASGVVFRAPVDRLPPDEDEEDEAGGLGAGGSASLEDANAAGRGTAASGGGAAVEGGGGGRQTVPDLVATAVTDAPLGSILALEPLAQTQGGEEGGATVDLSCRFASISADGTLRVFEAPSGQQLACRAFWRAPAPALLDVDGIVSEKTEGGDKAGEDRESGRGGVSFGDTPSGSVGAFQLGGSKRPSLHVAIRDGSTTEPAMSVSPQTVHARVPTFGSAASGAGTDADPLEEGGPELSPSVGQQPSAAAEGEEDEDARRKREDAFAALAVAESDAEAQELQAKEAVRLEDASRAVDQSLGAKAPTPGFTDELSCLASHPRLPLLAVGSSGGHVRLVAALDNSNQHAASTEGSKSPPVLLVSVHCTAAHRHPVTAASFCPGNLPLLATMSGEGRSVTFLALHLDVGSADKLKEDTGAQRAAARALLVPVGSALLPKVGIVPQGQSADDTFEVGRPLSMAWRCGGSDGEAEVVISHASGAVSAVPVPSTDHVRTACAVVSEAASEAEAAGVPLSQVDLRPFADAVQELSDRVSLHCLGAMEDGAPFQLLPPASSMHSKQGVGSSENGVIVTVCPTSPLVNVLQPAWTPGQAESSVVSVPGSSGPGSESKGEDEGGVQAHKVLADFEFVGPLVGHTSGALVVAGPGGAALTGDGEQVLLTCAADGSALAWVVDVARASSREASEVRFHAAGIAAAAISPDSSHFVTGGSDGSIVTASIKHESASRLAAPQPTTPEVNWWESVMLIATAVGSSEALGGGQVVSMLGVAAGSDGQRSVAAGAGGSIASDAIGIMASVGSIGSSLDGPAGPVAVEGGMGEDACTSWTAAQAATSDLLALRVAMRQEAVAREDRQVFRAELAEIQEQLQQLLAENETKPDIEKLDREEFVIDEEGKRQLEGDFQRQVTERRSELESRIEALSKEANEAKKEAFDSMEEPYWVVKGFRSGAVVESMPIRKITEEEESQLQRVTTLRRVEQEELRWHEQEASKSRTPGSQLSAEMVPGGRGARVWPDIATFFPSNLDWVFDCGLLAPSLFPVQQMKELADSRLAGGASGSSEAPVSPTGDGPAEAGGAGGQSSEEVDDRAAGGGGGADGEDGEDAGDLVGEVSTWEGESLVKLLYHPAAVRMPGQKRAQILLLRELVRAVQRTFNAQLRSVRDRKREEIKRIMDKSGRMRRIMEVEGFEGELFEPKLDAAEIEDSCFQVGEDIIGFPEYVSDAERARLAEEERIQREEAERNKDDAPERALDDMMSGTLAAKDEIQKLQDKFDALSEPWMAELMEAEEAARAEADADAAKGAVGGGKGGKGKGKGKKGSKTPSGAGGRRASQGFGTGRAAAQLMALEQALTDEQAEKVAAVRKVRSELRDRKAERRAALREEMDSLQQQIDGHVSAFDAALAEEVVARDEYLRCILAQEAYAHRLAVQVMGRDANIEREQAVLERMRGLEMEVEGVKEEMGELGPELEDARQQLSSAEAAAQQTSADRQLRTALRETAGDMERGVVQLLCRVFAWDVPSSEVEQAALGGSGGLEGADTEEGGSVPIDPYSTAARLAERKARALTAEADTRRLQARLREPSPREMPEGLTREMVPPIAWDQTMSKRKERIEAAHAVALAKKRVEMAERAERAIMGEIGRYQAASEALQGERAVLLEHNVIYGTNLPMVLLMRQGQDEVVSQMPFAPCVDYGDAVLAPKGLVERENRRIRFINSARVKWMERNRDFNKELRLLQWEKKYTEGSALDVKERLLDLQLLRVTKELNEQLKGGDIVAKQKHAIVMAEKRARFLQHTHKGQISKLQQQLRKLEKQVAKSRRENEQLEEQKARLAESVAVRTTILESRGGAGALNPKAKAERKMDTLVTRSRLVAMAKAHAEEIDFLRSELKRLRDRTFPSFANVKRPM